MRGIYEFGGEHLQHAFKIAEDLVVPHSDHAVTERIQECIAAPIGRAVGVLAAIHFNDQALFTADEIDVIRSDRLLARELQSTESAIAQGEP